MIVKLERQANDCMETEQMTPLCFEGSVRPDEAGIRAGTWLKRRFGCSAQLVKRIRLEGQLHINGRPARMKTLLKADDTLWARPSPKEQAPALYHPRPAFVLEEDPWLLLCQKPPGMLVHPSMNKALPDLCTALSSFPLHPINRLDRDTSGLVLIGKHGHAHYRMSQRPITKLYLAFVHGRAPKAGQIDLPIGRSAHSIIERLPSPAGQKAATRYWRLHYFPSANASILAMQLLTGRTHQLRVHSLAMGHPLMGESLYGLSAWEEAAAGRQTERVLPDARAADRFAPKQAALDSLIARQALHAALLAFQDPQSEAARVIHAPLLPDMLACLQALNAMEGDQRLETSVDDLQHGLLELSRASS